MNIILYNLVDIKIKIMKEMVRKTEKRSKFAQIEI